VTASAGLIQLQGAARTFSSAAEQVQALRETSLQIGRGEQVAIVGPSGSGKSTLMNILGLLDKPTEGRYELDGVDTGLLNVDRKAALRSQTIGFVFQSFHLIPHLSAHENVALPLRYRDLKAHERNEQVSECLAAVGLEHRGAHLPQQMSGGERQRVAVARALVASPKLLLADEPTGSLDIRSGKAVLSLMMSLSASQGTTLIIITHDLGLAKQLPRRIEIVDGAIDLDTGVNGTNRGH
jgi:putative ABC transport system ATP-binding protein